MDLQNTATEATPVEQQPEQAPMTRRAAKRAARKAGTTLKAVRKASKGSSKKAAKKDAAPKDGERLVQPDLSHYVTGKTEEGKRTIDIGDATAKQLRGLDLDAVYKLAAKALKVSESELRARYAKLNPGMQRMNLGNRMRAVSK